MAEHPASAAGKTWDAYDEDPAGTAVGLAEDERKYADMLASLHFLLDQAAAARSSHTLIETLAKRLRQLSQELAIVESDASTKRDSRPPIAGRRQITLPRIENQEVRDGAMSGTVTFGRRFLGRNGVVHGGSVAYLFDDALGRLTNAADGPKARTAYLHIDYRSTARINTSFQIRCWCESATGRKRLMRGDLRADGVLLAEAEALFVVPKPA